MQSQTTSLLSAISQVLNRFKLAHVRLLIAWLCSLPWGYSTMLVLFGSFSINFFGFSVQPDWVTIFKGLGGMLLITFILSFVLSYENHDGIATGFWSFLAGLTGYLVGWQGAGYFHDALHNDPYFGGLSSFLRELDKHSLLAFMSGVSAVAVIGTINLSHSKSFTRWSLEFIISIVIGLSLTLINTVILGPTHLTWQVAPFIWISAVYFTELTNGKTTWVTFVIWLLLALTTFGLAFIWGSQVF